MPDELDRASDIEIASTEEGIRRSLAKLRPQYDSRFDGIHCVDCGEALPAIRVTNTRVRCVDCQELVDRKGKLWNSR